MQPPQLPTSSSCWAPALSHVAVGWHPSHQPGFVAGYQHDCVGHCWQAASFSHILEVFWDNPDSVGALELEGNLAHFFGDLTHFLDVLVIPQK